MKKITFFLCALLFAAMSFATEASIDLSAQGYENAQEVPSITVNDDVTVTLDKGTNSNTPKYYNTGTAVRVYAGGFFVIKTQTGKITKIELTFGTGDGANEISTEVGSYGTGVWAGVADSVKFTVAGTTGHRRIKGIKVTYGEVADDFVVAPTISGDAEFIESTTISISASTGAKIYYTLDNTVPTQVSTEYTTPFDVTATTTVKAIAYVGDNASEVTTLIATKATKVTCSEAAKLALEVSANNVTTDITYVVEGYVTSIVSEWNGKKQTFWIADEVNGGNVFEAYYCFISEAVNLGDKVQLFGKLTKFNSTPEMSDGQAVILEKANDDTPEKPGEGEQPGEGEKPGEGEQPGEGEKPGEGEQPGEGEKPGEGEQPGEGETPSEGEIWLLVLDAAELQAGDQVVIAANEADYALSINQKKNNRGQVAITKTGTTISINDSVQVLTLETGTKANTLAFNTGNGYLYAAASDGNYLRTDTALSDNSSWVITITEGVASIVAQGEFTRNTMQYNATSSLFSCYAPDKPQKPIALYKKTLAEDIVVAPAIAGETNFLESTTVTITAAEGLKVYYTLDGTEPTNASTEYTAPFELTATTTVKAIAYKGDKASAVVSKTFTKMSILTCEEAVALCTPTASKENYIIRGYVTEMIEAYNPDFKNMTFWMADTQDGGQVLQAFRVKPVSEVEQGLQVGDFVEVTGTLVLYGDNKVPEVNAGGSVKLLERTALDNIAIQQTITKIIRNGQLLIIKDGVLYNAQGQVIK